MNNILSNRHNIFGKLGDFWYRQLSESASRGTQFARSFTHLVDASSAIGSMQSLAQRFAGSSYNIKSNYTIKFNPADVSVINVDLNQRSVTGSYPTLTINKEGQYVLQTSSYLQIVGLTGAAATEVTETGLENVLGDNDYGGLIAPVEDRQIVINADEARPLFYLPIPLNVCPVCITTLTDELTVGYSFITNPGYILFYDNPLDLFPDSQIVCRSAYVLESHPMDYTYQVDNVYSAGNYVARYMRMTSSAKALRLALAEIAGLPIIKKESVLQAIYSGLNATTYEFDTEVIRVPNYIEHTTLTVGTTYAADTIIAEDYIKVFTAGNSDGSPWYRATDLQDVWTADGLQLNGVTPFSSLVVPDVTGTFGYNGSTAGGGTAHLLISGLTGATAAYWNYVATSESYTNKYIADIPGVTAGATANCIDFYFDNMLTYNSIIIKLRTQELGSEIHSNVLSFIRRDLPVNLTPIILL